MMDREPPGISYASRLEHASSIELGHDPSFCETEANIMNEVADWLQSQHFDDFWKPKDDPSRKLPPTANQVLLQMEDTNMLQHNHTVSEASFERLLHSIALQLLASCYTVLPASSASNLPISPQRRHPQCITALRLHSQHRFEPAAGHHARVSSETDSWPGLYHGQCLKEQLAEEVSRKRRQNKKPQDISRSRRNMWLDGASLLKKRRTRKGSHSTVGSGSPTEGGFFSRLICQASTPKNPKRRHNTLFANFASRRNKHKESLETSSGSVKARNNILKTFQDLSSTTVQRIPSVLRLRRTQSAPRSMQDDAKPVRPSYGPQRHSSNPSIGSPLNYPFEIPQIRHTSATPGEAYGEGNFDSVRMCGRGDLITANEYLEEREATHVLHSEEHSRHSLSLPSQIPEAASSSSVALSNAAPTYNRTTIPSPPKYPTDYFASVHAATHVHDDKDSEIDPTDNLTEEREDAGPSIDECPMLQKMFGKMDAPQDDDSSDSDMERLRKRKSILGGENDMEHCILERFKPRDSNDSLKGED